MKQPSDIETRTVKAEFYKPQVKRLLEMLENQHGDEAPESSTLAVAELFSGQRWQAERAMFRTQPIIVGHASEIAESGDYVVRDIDSRSWLLVRGKDGIARAFLNYCQHRGTRLVSAGVSAGVSASGEAAEDEQRGCAHRFSCPYHAWTYDSTGTLIGVPRDDLFPGLDKKQKGLRSGHLQERFGLLWLTQEVTDAAAVPSIDDFLDGLTPEFEALELQDHHLYYDHTRELKADWKLPLFAFLESYHLSVLHKDSIAEFFYANIAHSEQFGPHIRSFVPRRNAGELADADLAEASLSDYVTPTNIIFPNVCMIGHPTSLSILCMFPGSAPGTASWRHMLLVPKPPESDAEIAHYEKTIRVLDGMTYQSEDFWVSEQIQQGINAGALDEMTLSTNEHLLKVFDDTVRQYL